jgi:VWFA-related protein
MQSVNRLSLFLCGLALQAQAPAVPDDFTIRADVNLIVLHATVQGGRGQFVSGLTREAFRVAEDGVPQEITLFVSNEVPVVAGVVIDQSGSMGRRRPDVIVGALTFVQRSNPADEMFVVNFNNTAQLGLPDEKPFSTDVHELRNAMINGEVGGQTALYDAIALAVNQMQKAKLMKKVLLVISDGGDNRSRHILDNVIKLADRDGVLIYTIGVFDEFSEDRNPGVLRKLARQTGGVSFFPNELSKLKDVWSQIARDVRNQYTIGYSSKLAANDAKFHEVKLTAVDERRRSLRVRTRAGYFGAKAHEASTVGGPRQ